ncbi:ATP-grasp fold amidoligase family protein [Tropicimonas sp. TH_r6]|uniref:ATP-grasp fold amidoligase family protein n=1 Tax=Tropicimonas sp. TH_r6 TaxID=3082085 RepID=UPI002953EA1B|nr:ATP-grasp fold amidoligase family protein [Tropicimonas sp. TH_r6]MDV7145714.1 ATP-grasp fold amidoligase family protein [Tropicimonas sp. TH_r6]
MHEALVYTELEDFRSEKIARFEKRHGYTPDLTNPRLFSEKLLTRILNDRDPFYTQYGTKLNAPEFLKVRMPRGLSIAKIYKVKERITPSDFGDLPAAFVLKSSFGSGLNHVITDLASVDLDRLCQRFNDRLPNLTNAQGFTCPDNVVLFEEFLGTPDGATPDDYKFHCFSQDGKPPQIYIQIDTDRFGNHQQSLYDQNFRLLDLRIGKAKRHRVQPSRPESLEKMIEISAFVSRGFDYIRVDLYSIDGRIYFGEFTPFHQGAMGPVSSREWDMLLGEHWNFRMPAYQHPLKRQGY